MARQNQPSVRCSIREYAIPEMSTGVKINYMDATVRGALFGDYNADGVIDTKEAKALEVYTVSGSTFGGQSPKSIVPGIV